MPRITNIRKHFSAMKSTRNADAARQTSVVAERELAARQKCKDRGIDYDELVKEHRRIAKEWKRRGCGLLTITPDGDPDKYDDVMDLTV